MVFQVIDAKEDSGDCQREHLSRKLTTPRQPKRASRASETRAKHRVTQ